MSNNNNLFCSNCGKEIVEETKFCPNCGQKIEIDEISKATEEDVLVKSDEIKDSTSSDNSINEEVQPPLNTDKTQKEPEFTHSTKKDSSSSNSLKIILAIVIPVVILIISAIITFIVVKSSNSPEKLVEEFRVSITDENYEELKEILIPSDDRLEINKDSLKPTVAYFKSNPSMLNEVCTTLKMSSLSATNSRNTFYIQKEDGVLGILGKYKIIINPVFLKVDTKLDNTEIMINEKEYDPIKEDEVKEIGPLMPGEYEITSKYVGEYITLENKTTKDLMSNDTEVCYLFNDIRTVVIETEYKDALVIVNGKNTGKTVEQLTSKISPVDNGTRVQLELNVEGKKFNTDEKVIGENNTIKFEKIKDIKQYIERKENLENFENNLDNSVLSLMNEYSIAFEYAVNYRSFSYLTGVLYPNSRLYTMQQDYVNLCAKNNVYESFISLSTKNITYDPETTTGTVYVEEIYETYTNGVYNKKPYYYTYTFKYNDSAKRFQLIDMVE